MESFGAQGSAPHALFTAYHARVYGAKQDPLCQATDYPGNRDTGPLPGPRKVLNLLRLQNLQKRWNTLSTARSSSMQQQHFFPHFFAQEVFVQKLP